MELTRREFAAATAGGLSLFVFGKSFATAEPRVSSLGAIRHVHLELPAGSYTRAQVARIAAQAAEAVGLHAPDSITVLGGSASQGSLPAAFAMSCAYPDGPALVVRAAPSHTDLPELTVRGQHGSLELRYSEGRFQI